MFPWPWFVWLVLLNALACFAHTHVDEFGQMGIGSIQDMSAVNTVMDKWDSTYMKSLYQVLEKIPIGEAMENMRIEAIRPVKKEFVGKNFSSLSFYSLIFYYIFCKSKYIIYLFIIPVQRYFL
jgi:hypothetical protein